MNRREFTKLAGVTLLSPPLLKEEDNIRWIDMRDEEPAHQQKIIVVKYHYYDILPDIHYSIYGGRLCYPIFEHREIGKGMEYQSVIVFQSDFMYVNKNYRGNRHLSICGNLPQKEIRHIEQLKCMGDQKEIYYNVPSRLHNLKWDTNKGEFPQASPYTFWIPVDGNYPNNIPELPLGE